MPKKYSPEGQRQSWIPEELKLNKQRRGKALPWGAHSQLRSQEEMERVWPCGLEWRQRAGAQGEGILGSKESLTGSLKGVASISRVTQSY